MENNINMSRLLAIGDIHIRMDNIEDIHLFIQKLEQVILQEKPHIIILLGDILHTHERIHTICLQYAQKVFEMCSSHVPTYVLVGNHDYISNSQFLTSQHWMTPFSRWHNLTIVDRVTPITHESHTFIACPYVPDGRLVEALNTVDSWKTANMIFGHQTLDGVKMGAIVAEHVEAWLPEYPFLCSGHIHDKQVIQPNLYYTGTPMQHAFGEKRNKSIALFTVTDKVEYKEIELRVSLKRIEYMTIADAMSYTLHVEPHETVRLTIRGSKEECRVFRKTSVYQQLIQKAKVVLDELVHDKEESSDTTHTFHQVLYDAVKNNYFMTCLYKKHASLPFAPDIEFI